MIRAVIDTNVLVSGLLSPRGNEALILLAIHQGLVHPCDAVLAMFRQQGQLFHAAAPLAASLDPDDTKFLQCAEAAQAEYIVTGNKRHFPESVYGLTSIVSAGELLDRITQEIR